MLTGEIALQLSVLCDQLDSAARAAMTLLAHDHAHAHDDTQSMDTFDSLCGCRDALFVAASQTTSVRLL
jgi:hypothetical protein